MTCSTCNGTTLISRKRRLPIEVRKLLWLREGQTEKEQRRVLYLREWWNKMPKELVKCTVCRGTGVRA